MEWGWIVGIIALCTVSAIIKFALTNPTSIKKASKKINEKKTENVLTPQKKTHAQLLKESCVFMDQEIEKTVCLDGDPFRIYARFSYYFDLAFSQLDIDEMFLISSILLNDTPWNDDEYVQKHFVLSSMAGKFYKIRDREPMIDDMIERLCQQDIGNIPHLIDRFRGCNLETLTRLCMLYEKQGRTKEAINLCDIGMQYGLIDNGKASLQLRKERLEKKLARATT